MSRETCLGFLDVGREGIVGICAFACGFVVSFYIFFLLSEDGRGEGGGGYCKD